MTHRHSNDRAIWRASIVLLVAGALGFLFTATLITLYILATGPY